VSTFFNRVDAILTSIISHTDKNQYFKPGQTYVDLLISTFSLQTVLNMKPPSSFRWENPYCWTIEQIFQIRQKVSRIFTQNIFASLKQQLILLSQGLAYDQWSGTLSNLQLEYLFESVRVRQMVTELVCRMYKLEQMEATQSVNSLVVKFASKVPAANRFATTTLILLKWWSRLWSDYVFDTQEKNALSDTIMALFVAFSMKRGLLTESETQEACDSHVKSIILAINFLVFVLFEFKMGEDNASDDSCYASL